MTRSEEVAVPPTPSRFVFREITTPVRLREFFALRYRVYREEVGLRRLGSLDHTAGLDVDAHDLSSRQYGLFAAAGSRETLIGGLRVTELGRSPYGDAMRAAAADAPTALARLERGTQAALPMAGYSVEAATVRTFLAEASRRGESVVEAGRLVLVPEWRASACACGLARFSVTAITSAYFNVRGTQHALVNCRVEHRGFYRPFGFIELVGTRAHAEPLLEDRRVETLHGRATWMSRAVRERCESFAYSLSTHGEVSFEPATETVPAEVAA